MYSWKLFGCWRYSQSETTEQIAVCGELAFSLKDFDDDFFLVVHTRGEYLGTLARQLGTSWYERRDPIPGCTNTLSERCNILQSQAPDLGLAVDHGSNDTGPVRD